MSLVQKFIPVELQSWFETTQISSSIEDILVGVQQGFYTAEKGSQVIAILIQKALARFPLPDQLNFDHFKTLIDEGDYIQATGKLEYSQSGEPSLFVDQYSILTKSLRPLPEKLEHTNTESRYLDRVADFKSNTTDDNDLSVREIVRMKAKYWDIWRDEMDKEEFLSVDCPIFESVPGGAEAKPFTTFYNELDQEMYLRISLELPLKKLIAGGFERVYEIGRIFRNEGSSPQHLQEYSQIEWYCAYTDYNWAAKFVKRVYQRVVEEILGKMTQVAYNGKTIDWSEWCTATEAKKHGWELISKDNEPNSGWPKIPYFEAVRYFSNGKIDTENKTAEELVEMSKANGISEARVQDGMGTLLDRLWKKARVNTTHPFYLTLPPVELEPLAKRDPKNKELTQRWQIVAGGAELGKAFSELNDPIDQFGRLEDQQKARDEGNDEAQFMDMDYVKAMEYGMPPMSGFGTSERFVSFLLGKHIKECVTFPHVRSEESNVKSSKEKKVKYLKEQIEKYTNELKSLEKTKDALDTTETETLKTNITKNFGKSLKYEELNFGAGTTLEYWNDSYLFESAATVKEIGNDEKGSFVVLDKTIFYPQGGGQPSDIGTISTELLTANITKCVKEGDQVWHYGEIGNLKVGDQVNIKIDRERRTQNIKLHSAAHLIDFAITELGHKWPSNKGYSFPEGPYNEYFGEIEVTPELIASIETKANELRLQNLNFETRYEMKDGEIYRTIVINGQETDSSCACGGTHINNTSELPLIKIRKIQSKKGFIKVSYAVEE